jgi:hypothetical protein
MHKISRSQSSAFAKNIHMVLVLGLPKNSPPVTGSAIHRIALIATIALKPVSSLCEISGTNVKNPPIKNQTTKQNKYANVLAITLPIPESPAAVPSGGLILAVSEFTDETSVGLSRRSKTPTGLCVGVQPLCAPNSASQFQHSTAGRCNSAEQFGQ